jgi:hypothetical protein
VVKEKDTGKGVGGITQLAKPIPKLLDPVTRNLFRPLDGIESCRKKVNALSPCDD